MGNEEEIREAIDAAKSVGNENLILLKCCTRLPLCFKWSESSYNYGYARALWPAGRTVGSFARINPRPLLRRRFGAVVIEKHFCLDRKIKNADSDFPWNRQNIRDGAGVHDAELALGTVSYGPIPDEAEEFKNRRSLFVVKDIKAGECFTAENVRSIRPYDGLKPKYYEEILGKTAVCDIRPGTPLAWELINR